MSHIVYLSKARLPTEKAHGFQVMKMCEGMATLGHDVALLHPRRYQSDAALAEADPFAYYGVTPNFRLHTLANWDVVRLERWLPEYAFRVAFTAHDLAWGLLAARRAAQLKPDLIYTRSASFAYWAARLGQGCVFEAHLPPDRRTVPFIRGLARQSSLRGVFALTSYTASDLEAAGVPKRKLEVLPDAADLSAFAGAPPKGDARRQLDLPIDRRIIGYVGRFETMGKEKGIGDLIRAMATPELRRTQPLLLCVGGPMERVREYMRLADAVGVPSRDLRFIDRVPNRDVPIWLAALDVGALPYPAAEHYGTAMSPLKLFEYMAAGLPIVATDLPALREVLADGENALLVPPGDPQALATRLTSVLDDAGRARALGAQARRDAARYTWERRAERALALAL